MYSSLDAAGAPVKIAAQGVTVEKLAGQLNIPVKDIELLKFSSSDGWSRSYDALSYLNKPRYYFPQIVRADDSDFLDAESGQEYIDEGLTDKLFVPAMLALSSDEGRYEENPSMNKLSQAEALRFCYGQEVMTDTVMLNYGKNINSMTITLKSGSSYLMPEGEEEKEGQSALGPPRGVPEGGTPERLDTTGLRADTLTITVGYYGGEYYTKKVFTGEEMEAMATVQQVYSYIDNMPAVCLDAAVGVPLRRILEEAGVDVNSVQSFNFYCADVSRTWYASMTKAHLLDLPRFYYPNLPMHWDYEEMKPAQQATLGAVEVEAILALNDKWRRFATDIDFTDMTESTRYRLLFGQKDVFTIEGARAAKWVHTIAVTLGGTPEEESQSADLLPGTKVGSQYQTGDGMKHDGGVEKDLGGAGTELISADLEKSSGTVPAEAGDSLQGKRIGVFRLMLNGTPLEENSVDGAGVQNWRKHQMAEDAVVMPDLKLENPLLTETVISLAVLFLLSIAGRMIKYRMEV